MSEAQLEAFVERVSRAYGEDEKRYVAGDDGVARVPILGATTKQPDFFFSMFGEGNAVYGDIIAGVREADADPKVKQIVLEIDSSGGELDGLQSLLDTIAAAKTETVAHVTDKALSAAYGIAAQADRIVVNNESAMLGSIGVIVTQYVDDQVVTTRSTEAPKKAQKPDSEEGATAVQEMVDGAHDIFVSAIASGRARATGRDISAETVNERYGRGAIVYARDAKSAGMIDEIAKAPKARAGKPAAASKGGRKAQATEERIMTLEELRAQHPALFAEVRELGVQEERDRVSAHLTMAESTGAFEAAAGFIKDGTGFTANAQATYMAAATKQGVTSARQEDEAETDPGTDPGSDEAAETAHDHKVMDEVTKAFGYDPAKLGGAQA